jgi:hypothetical protein
MATAAKLTATSVVAKLDEQMTARFRGGQLMLPFAAGPPHSI